MRVVWTPEANADRLAILEYIAADNPRAAVRMDLLFLEAAGQLTEFPMLGRSGKVPHTREMIPHESYRLVYEVDEAAETIWVLVLIHTARRWSRPMVPSDRPPAPPHCLLCSSRPFLSGCSAGRAMPCASWSRSNEQ